MPGTLFCLRYLDTSLKAIDRVHDETTVETTSTVSSSSKRNAEGKSRTAGSDCQITYILSLLIAIDFVMNIARQLTKHE